MQAKKPTEHPQTTAITKERQSALAVAIIGAGPSGYYTAEALTKACPSCQVDLIDRLPTPFGLIRAGVAPDHQSIKNVARRYTSTNTQDNVRFIGNLSLGRDITLGELQNLYHAVVLATGAAKDRKLNIDGENLKGVYGASAFVGWYNSHPDYKDLNPNLDISAAVIIGNGNVALDVARILAKTPAEFAGTDLARHARHKIACSPLKDIYIIGRRGPLHSAFTPKELSELQKLEQCTPVVSPKDLPNLSTDAFDHLPTMQKKNLTLLLAMQQPDPKDQRHVKIHLNFFRRPVAILGTDHPKAIRLEETTVNDDGICTGTGKTEKLPTGLIVSCIGYRSSPITDIPYDDRLGRFISDDKGQINPGLYTVGWARRGPTGTIGTNKPDGAEIAATILENHTPNPAEKLGRAGLDTIIEKRGLDIVTFSDWKKIDQAEIDAAKEGESRHKFPDIDTMVAIANADAPKTP